MRDFEKIKVKVAPVFREYGVDEAAIFGSVARGEASDKSDVDFCVKSGLRGMKFVGLVEALREALGGREVDVLDVTHIEAGSEVAREIEEHGVLIYG